MPSGFAVTHSMLKSYVTMAALVNTANPRNGNSSWAILEWVMTREIIYALG